MDRSIMRRSRKRKREKKGDTKKKGANSVKQLGTATTSANESSLAERRAAFRQKMLARLKP